MSTQPSPSQPSRPSWLVDEPFNDIDLGLLRSGKEAQINVIERTGADNTTCLLALKRYLPREVKHKGHLQALGVERASTFRNDVAYREGRQFRKTRDRRAIERMSTYGKRLLQDRWTGHEHDIMSKLWAAGLRVPYPVSYGDDLFTLEYVGDRDGAAPQLNGARIERSDMQGVFDQLLDGLAIMTTAGIAHGDLSAYNILWWQDELWFIDFPQAVDIATNPQGLNFLHRDVLNICDWFSRRGVEADAEEVFADLLARYYS